MSKLETNTIDTVSGTTNLTIGSTNSSTVTFENGAVTGHMYPAFQANLSSNQTGISDATTALVQLNNTELDTNSAFNTSTYTFTCPIAGKYFVYAKTTVLSSNTAREHYTYVYKNGSAILSNLMAFIGTTPIINDGSSFSGAQTSGIVDLAVNDTLKLYGKMNTTSGATFSFVSGIAETTLGAYRIGA